MFIRLDFFFSIPQSLVFFPFLISSMKERKYLEENFLIYQIFLQIVLL